MESEKMMINTNELMNTTLNAIFFFKLVEPVLACHTGVPVELYILFFFILNFDHTLG